MRPETSSRRLLGITRSKAKMYEYDVPLADHITIPRDPANLFPLSIGLLGDLASRRNSEDGEQENDLKSDLGFSAQFFDNYLQAHLREPLDPYLILLGSAAYYLCDLPGSSSVLAKSLDADHFDLGCLGVESLLLWLLQGDFNTRLDERGEPFGPIIQAISKALVQYFENGTGAEQLFSLTSELRQVAYQIGTPRQLLLADVSVAITRERIENSTWFRLPKYSGLPLEMWIPILKKETFIKELWPAQIRLGENGVFSGKSAIVQMPTSAGKTKAIEILIRSSFLAGRAAIAVIVAPFRALCHEIRNDLVRAFKDDTITVNELSDVMQPDFDLANVLERQHVLVVTPEKLVHVLRYTPEFANQIGLLIYDEGHQFDNSTRGVTYELLVTSLKRSIPKEAQTVLISAVISNPEAIGNWLNGEDSVIVIGNDLIPTYRTLAFASWLTPRGQLRFVDPTDPDIEEFYVPRVIEQLQLQRKPKERKERVFPERENGNDIALYLGFKLVSKGSIALFVGRKDSVTNLCERAVEVYSRGLPFSKPADHSVQSEIERLTYLHRGNLGDTAITTQSAALGVFAHHNNVPHGIRISIEYALKNNLARFVICTSTLAQGVNLPIRYLIVTSMNQGGEPIKVRDFHNLIGRAGRSGMYTEGSILFADPRIYDIRDAEYWRWQTAKTLLDPNNSEACTSTLSLLLNPIEHPHDIGISIEPIEFVNAYVAGRIPELLENAIPESARRIFSSADFSEQVELNQSILSAVESYLMMYWNQKDPQSLQDEIEQLASETLAYFLGGEYNKEQLVAIFKLLAENIAQKIPEDSRRKAFAKTFYGVQTSLVMEDWVKEYQEALISCSSQEELLNLLWRLILPLMRNSTVKRCNPSDPLLNTVLNWIQGEIFKNLFEVLKENNVRIGRGQNPRYMTVEFVVDICENGFAFDAMLVVGAVAEIIQIVHPTEINHLVRNLQGLQKRLKYGLPSQVAITLYEMGFADRVIALEMSTILRADSLLEEDIVIALRTNLQQVEHILAKYPIYFTHILNELLG